MSIARALGIRSMVASLVEAAAFFLVVTPLCFNVIGAVYTMVAWKWSSFQSAMMFFPYSQASWGAWSGVLPVWMWANTLPEIESAVEWADREKVKLVILGGLESPLAADLLKRKNIPVVVTPILSLPRGRDDDYDEPFTVPAKLFREGVKFCISGSSSEGNDRNLPYHAAMASAYGLPKEEALKSVTQYAAEILSVADRVGTLAKGKDATLIVASGDPLEITTQIEKMYIQGREIDLNNKQKTLYRKYQEKYRQLSGK